MEKWKSIKNYEDTYLISNLGRVKRIGKYKNQFTEWESNHILKPGNNGSGYWFVILSKDNKTKQVYIHRLVAEVFVDNPNFYDEVNHKDGNKSNNYASNLEWVTRSQNQIHAYEKLKRPSLKNHPEVSKPVLQFDLQGNFIKEYPSYREAQRQTGIHAIEKVCAGAKYRKTAGGFIWKYKEDLQ